MLKIQHFSEIRKLLCVPKVQIILIRPCTLSYFTLHFWIFLNGDSFLTI